MKFKYLEVYDYVLSLIEKGKDGDPLPSQNDLRSLFDVCHITVRKALDEMEHRGLIFRKKGKGTFIRKKSPVKRRLNFLIVIPPKKDLSSAYLNSILSGIVSSSRNSRSSIQIFHFQKELQELLKKINENRIDGIIGISLSNEYLRINEELRERGYPVMLINQLAKNHQVNYVCTDGEKGAKEITSYLLNKGHRKIGFVGLIKGVEFTFQRYNGFCKAYKKMGYEISAEMVVNIQIKPTGEWNIRLMKEDIRNIVQKFKPTAFFCAQGAVLLATLKTIKDLGLKIPKDMELATFDEVPENLKEKKNIHEVIQPLFSMGKIALEEIEKIAKSEKGTAKIFLAPSLKIKENEPI